MCKRYSVQFEERNRTNTRVYIISTFESGIRFKSTCVHFYVFPGAQLFILAALKHLLSHQGEFISNRQQKDACNQIGKEILVMPTCYPVEFSVCLSSNTDANALCLWIYIPQIK